MPSRNTRTGAIFERILIPALQAQSDFYEFFARGQQTKGKTNPRILPDPFRPGKTHTLDILVLVWGKNPEAPTRIGVSVKWQQVGGTAEEKVALEFLRLIKFIEQSKLDRGYIVLGGTGWSLLSYYTGEDFRKAFSSPAAEQIVVLGVEAFIERVNRRLL